MLFNQKPNTQTCQVERRFRPYLGKGVGAIDWKNYEKARSPAANNHLFRSVPEIDYLRFALELEMGKSFIRFTVLGSIHGELHFSNPLQESLWIEIVSNATI